jgi:hypothetical protein
MEQTTNASKHLGQQLAALRKSPVNGKFYVLWATAVIFCLFPIGLYRIIHGMGNRLGVPTYATTTATLWIIGIGPWMRYCGQEYARAIKWSRFLELTVDGFLPVFMVGVFTMIIDTDAHGAIPRFLYIAMLTIAALTVVNKTLTNQLIAYHDKKFAAR